MTLFGEILDLLAASPAAWITVVFIFGLLVGSFLNVVIHRVPIMLEREWREQAQQVLNPEAAEPVTAQARYNLVVPRSACPKCGTMITAIQNVPVISYLFLKGKCAICGTHIPVRYPIVELA